MHSLLFVDRENSFPFVAELQENVYLCLRINRKKNFFKKKARVLSLPLFRASANGNGNSYIKDLAKSQDYEISPPPP